MAHETYGLLAHYCFLLLPFPFSEKGVRVAVAVSMARELEIGLKGETFATTTRGLFVSSIVSFWICPPGAGDEGSWGRNKQVENVREKKNEAASFARKYPKVLWLDPGCLGEKGE